MEIDWWYYSIFPIRIMLMIFSIYYSPRGVLLIKNGWKEDNDKVLKKGVSLLMSAVIMLIFSIILTPRIPGKFL